MGTACVFVPFLKECKQTNFGENHGHFEKIVRASKDGASPQ